MSSEGTKEKFDRLSMANGGEIRSPFLNKKVVNFFKVQENLDFIIIKPNLFEDEAFKINAKINKK